MGGSAPGILDILFPIGKTIQNWVIGYLTAMVLTNPAFAIFVIRTGYGQLLDRGNRPILAIFKEHWITGICSGKVYHMVIRFPDFQLGFITRAPPGLKILF